MSQGDQVDNFTDINLNAIKNTKLFQKFMQNKSGLINNGSKQSLKKVEQNIQKAQIQHKKWQVPKIRSSDQEIIMKSRQQKIKIAQKSTDLLKDYQNISHDQYKDNQQQIQSLNTNKQTYLREQVEQSYVEPYKRELINDRVISQQRIINSYETHQQRMSNNSVQVQSHERYSNNNQNQAERRKRQFNPYSNQLKKNPEIEQSIVNNNFYDNRAQKNPYSNSFSKMNSGSEQQHNVQPQRSSPNKSQLITLPVSLNQNEYRLKYQALLKKHEQLKGQYKNENKSRKKQLNQWEHQIEVIKQKLFDVQSRQDSLLIQNQRLKQKWQNQNLQKMKTQEQNKQLGYKIKQLEDQLHMRDNSQKQKADQINYWKSHADGIRQEFNSLKLSLQKKNDDYNLLYGDYNIVKKQRDNKDFLLDDLRHNISSLVQENSAAKDQLFSLVTKLYQLEQENQILKNDLKRQHLDPTQINYMRDRIQSSHVERQQRFQQYQSRQQQNAERKEPFRQHMRHSLTEQQRPIGNQPTTQKPTRKRGQFARQRGQVTRNQKPQRDQKPQYQQTHNKQTLHNRSMIQKTGNKQQTTKLNIGGNKAARIQQLSQQLQKLKDLKAMNGAIRRRKIDLQRQIQQLQGH